MSGVLYATAPLTVISEVQDRFANDLASYQGPWNGELKLFRANAASFEGKPQQGKALYALSLSNDSDTVYVHSPSASVTCTEGIDAILLSKMQSLWTLRQTFKLVGHSYAWKGAKIRIANVFVQGNYKGFVLDVDEATDEVGESLLEILAECGVSSELELRALSPLEKSALYQRLSR